MDLNQVMVSVKDLERSIAFYSGLGLRLIVSADTYARFELPSGSSTFSLIRSDAPDAGDTILYFEVDDVDAMHARLTAAGVVFEHPPEDQVYRWRTAPFRDPDGHPLCLYHAGPERRFPPWRLEA
ncbi:MAG: VOC family protein [Pseudomonadota bacterium]